MINLNPELTQEQARYVIEEVFPKHGYRIDHKTLAWWRDAHNYVFKEQVGIPGCSCEYIATYSVWRSRLGQYEQHIHNVAYPITTTETGETGYIENNPKPKVGRKPKSASGLTE
jgi:hypothetical protein